MSIVIVGAGITGLTLGLQFLGKGAKVLILEKEPVVGGLCRSYRYGKFSFDVGPHRLFSTDPAIMQFFLSVLGDQYTEVDRVSRVNLDGRYYDWPFTFKSVFGLPVKMVLGCFKDLLVRPDCTNADIATLKDYVTARYGATIYKIFWEDYTEKFLGLRGEEVDALWGSLSVGRSVVDRNARPACLRDLVRNCLVRPKSTLRFLYPKGGMGAYPDLCAALIRKMGGQIRLNEQIRSLGKGRGGIDRVLTNTGEYEADQVIWTGTLPDICTLLGEPAPDLAYLPSLLFNLEVQGAMPGEWQWMYFPDRDCVFSRVSRPGKFNPATTPAGMTGLCVEVTEPAGAAFSGHPERLVERVTADLVRAGLLDTAGRVAAWHIERVQNAYPIYRKGFQQTVEDARAVLGRYRNLQLAGRQALFVYDNIDEAVESALALAARLTASL